MKQDALFALIKGYSGFYHEYTSQKYDKYRKEAAVGQSPEIMVISCSDSRVNASILTEAPLGNIFEVCNVANIVPPYYPDSTYHSTSSALEFAVGTLAVKHIIILGHSGCGGVGALIDGTPLALDGECSFIAAWIEIIKAAKDKVAGLPKPFIYRQCELEALKISLGNLMTFPWIRERVKNNTLSVHAWHFDIGSGVIIGYDEEKEIFLPIKPD